MPDITYDVGRVSFIMKGAWNLATAYEKLDAVTHDGSLYIAKQDVPGGTAITNTTYWVLAVEKGDQGETGNGIASIAKTGTAGNVDTYTITYTDGTSTTFTVTNGGVTTVNGRTGDVTGLAEEEALGGTLRQLLVVKASIGFDTTDYVDLSTLSWSRYQFGSNYVFFANLTTKKSYATKGICTKYNIPTVVTAPADLTDKQMDISVNQTFVYIRDDDYSNATDFTAAMKGVLLAYEKA